MELAHSLDADEVAGYAADFCSHVVEHMAKLLDIRFTGGIVYCGLSLCHDSSHDDVCRSRYRSLVEQHIAALQLVGTYLIDIAVVDVAEPRSKIFEAEEMGVEPTATNLVASRLCYYRFVETGEQRSNHEHTASQRGALPYKLVALKIAEVDIVGTERVFIGAKFLHPHPDVLEEEYEIVYVADVGNVVNDDFLRGEQRGADDFESLVLGSLWRNGTTERMPTFNDECCHVCGLCGLRFLLLFLSLALLCLLVAEVNPFETEVVEIELYYAIGEACEVICHFLIVH